MSNPHETIQSDEQADKYEELQELARNLRNDPYEGLSHRELVKALIDEEARAGIL